MLFEVCSQLQITVRVHLYSLIYPDLRYGDIFFSVNVTNVNNQFTFLTTIDNPSWDSVGGKSYVDKQTYEDPNRCPNLQKFFNSHI